MIKIKNVDAGYDHTLIFKDLNLEINPGEFVCVIGTSGSGKTTLLKLITGLIKPIQGSIEVNGELYPPKDEYAFRKKLGFVFQNHSLFPNKTIKSNIEYVLHLNKKKLSDESLSKYLNLMKLDSSLLNRHPRELSGGQKQRVGIIRALVSEPQLLLMDEPFGALDAITRFDLQTEIKQIHKSLNTTIVFITHDIKEAILLGSRIIIVDQGQIIQDDTPEMIQSSPKNEFVKQLLYKAGY